MADSTPRRFRFRPKQPAVAATTSLLGAGLAIASLVAGDWGWVAVGAVATALGALYLASPAWRTEVLIDPDALEVLSGGDRRFRLPWESVTRVVVARAHRTAFIDGGAPGQSLLLPGRGARAPYRIENQGELLDAILARVEAEKVVEVERLDRYRRGGGA